MWCDADASCTKLVRGLKARPGWCNLHSFAGSLVDPRQDQSSWWQNARLELGRSETRRVRGDAEDRRSLQPEGTGVARLRGPFHQARHQSSGDSTGPPRLCGNTSGGDAEET